MSMPTQVKSSQLALQKKSLKSLEAS
ncbi:hypothetical protein RDABS01_017761 [Bienertia sinuspersici]